MERGTRSYWYQERDGWWHKRLSTMSYMLSMPAHVFEALMGRPQLEGHRDVLPVTTAHRTYSLVFHCGAKLNGAEVKAWLEDSGARQGDSIALKRQGGQVLFKVVPAASPPNEEVPADIRSPVAQQAARDYTRHGSAEDEQRQQPEQADVMQQQHPQQQQQQQPGQLPFTPAQTPSIAAALAVGVSLEHTISGATQLLGSVGGQPRWKVEFKRLGSAGRLTYYDRRQAAVAADLILSWRRALNDPIRGPVGSACLNIPSACYKDDRLLVQQLRQVASPLQMRRFLQTVLPCGQPVAAAEGQGQGGEQGEAAARGGQQQVKQEEGEEGQEPHDGDAAEAEEQEELECGLSFEPQQCASIAAALATPSGGVYEGTAWGVQPSRQRWGVWISWARSKACLTFSSKHAAAVAADVVHMWRQTCGTAQQKARAARGPNIPAAGYDQDEVLLAQLRQIGSAKQMKQFLQAVLPVPVRPTQQQQQQQKQQQQAGAGESQAVRTVSAAADTVSADPTPCGSRKRKQREPDSGVDTALQQSLLQAVHGQEHGATLPPTRPVSPQARQGVQAAQQQQLVAAPAQRLQQPSPSARSTGFIGAAQAVPGRLEELACAEQQAFVVRAEAAFAAADRDLPSSLLRPLQLLVLAEHGGQLLQQLVKNWTMHSPAQQQAAYGAALMACSRGTWDRLEQRLQLALDAAA